MLIITHGDPRDPQAQALLHSSHALMLDLFPAEDNYALEIDDLLTPDIRFFIAREGPQVLGIGALAIREGYGEVKSMFTDKGARGKGVAAALLRQIEDEARSHDLTTVRGHPPLPASRIRPVRTVWRLRGEPDQRLYGEASVGLSASQIPG